MESNIEVAARIRPPIHTVINHTVEDVCLYAVPYTKEIILANQMSFYVDFALPMESNQSQVFDTIVQPRVEHMLQGYDVSFIAYGHVNSGKSYTILGPSLHCALSETKYGILPRTAREIFNRLLSFRQQYSIQFSVSISFIEICNEEARDLLSTSQSKNNLFFKTNEKGLTTLAGVEEIECHNVSEVFNCIRIGMGCRQTVRTNINSASSLSHCVVILKVKQKWISNQGQVETRSSQAMFVDLAGSEQMFLMSPIGSQAQAQQAVANTGLGVISAIIASFSGQWLPSSPFTQSLLFPLLKDSFIGSIKTLLICCLSPSSSDYSETLNSLRLIDHIHMLNKYSFVKEMNKLQNKDEIIENNDNECVQTDSFGLEFAASQWLKLVSNAEGLFNKLVSNDMPEGTREQIEEWLCLKQECEECFSVESKTSNVQSYAGRSLERIEEVTETDTKSKSDHSERTSDSGNSTSSLDSEDGEEIDEGENDEEDDDDYDDDFDSEDDNNDENGNKSADEMNTSSCIKSKSCKQEVLFHTQKTDFVEKLEHLMDKFKDSTDHLVDKVIHSTCKSTQSDEGLKEKQRLIPSEPKPWSALNGRRKSILPGETKLCLLPNLTLKHLEADNLSLNLEVNEKEHDIIEDAVSVKTIDDDNNLLSSIKASIEPKLPTESDNQFRVLSANNCIKQSQLGLANLDLEAASKRLDELQSMINIKEQFIEEIIKNSGARISAKAKFQRKHTRLEEEYFKARSQLAKAEKALLHEKGNTELESEVEKYKAIAMQYEKRLEDIELIKQITGDSAKKVLELENSLHNSKRKMLKLKKQLKKEEEHKFTLEQELIEDQKRIKDLEEKYKRQTDKLNGRIEDDGGGDDKKLKWIAKEEERLIQLQESSQKLQEQLQEKQNMLEKRESFLKEKLSQEKNINRSLLYVSGRISHLEQVLKEKSTNLEKAADLDTKEALRHEIRNLRKTRDCLVEQRRNLDAKFNKDKVLTTVEERKFLECDEAIEAIDATIEYKNELMCGRKGIVGTEYQNGEREKSDEMLLDRLMKLSPIEMRTLLYKYFQKVIDLRESGRKMEAQVAELDRQSEAQVWKIQALSNALQQAHLESERKLIAIQKEHQEKLHLVLRHFAEETSGHSSGADDSEKCRRQNKALKQRILELEAMLYKARGESSSSHLNGPEMASAVAPVTECQLNIPQHNLKRLQGAAGSSSHTTKVTRHKNKLIIQQHQDPSKKQSK